MNITVASKKYLIGLLHNRNMFDSILDKKVNFGPEVLLLEPNILFILFKQGLPQFFTLSVRY